ncbi:uncharacterized protein LOC111714996 isoform X2 [Eurytemora carolleeae]|uniref:uncharacterized protein LOC111714996 isoform X2 n=1 Tax=Eurytemora carolleeae TaxID=1294199 RepID=UPI000C782F6D|nr:uncharacterized protein LOC111714996 isoform X2 [Eurytemora carolleeae]|eukprot:XP_023345994.1 uncharacterized protein LOC111714996 isoform X2 [Eurytemora affinis]
MWVLGRLGEWVSFLTWNLLLALLYLFRKCIFLVSFQQFFSHCVQVYQFLTSASNYAQSSTAVRAHKIVRKKKNFSDDKRSHRSKRDLRKDDNSGYSQSFLTKSGLPKDLGKDLSKPFDRKVSTTLLNIKHQDNYARNRDFWTGNPLRSIEGSSGRGSDSDTSVYSCKDSMGNSMDSERLFYSKPDHNSTPVHKTGSTDSNQRTSSNYRSSDSTDSFIMVGLMSVWFTPPSLQPRI